jgi:hypothetical protein
MTGRLILGLALSLAGLAAEEATGWRAGVAQITVTPAGPIWMAGFGARDKPSEGVWSDLRVKALSIQQGSAPPVVIVTADLIGFSTPIADAIATQVREKYGIARERLLLNASHQHSGPMLSLEYRPRPGGGPPGGAGKMTEEHRQVVVRYTRELVEKIVALVGRSLDDRAAARLEFEQGLAGIAVNRRRSRLHTRQFPGPVDQDVPVLAVRAPDGKLRAVLFGYACHPTTNAAYKITADYPGYAQAEIEKLYPGSIALFVQGCGADQNPLPRYHSFDAALIDRSHELSKGYGHTLAMAVDLVLRGKMAPLAGPLVAARDTVSAPFEPLPSRAELEQRTKSADADRAQTAKRLLRALDAGKKPPAATPYVIQIYRFGKGLKLVALMSEVVVDFSLRIKAAHGWEDTWVAGYSNGMAGYIPSRRVLMEGGYETGGSEGGAYSAAAEETILEEVDQMVRGTAR